MTEPRDLEVENALLRGSLFLAARALKDYADARHTKTERGLQLTVPESLPVRAAEALVRAEGMLQGHGRGR